MINVEDEFAISVNNAYSGYSKDKGNVLQGITFQVHPGTIYGLVGARRCGKTTLLKCILGKLKTSSGSIQLGVTKHESIGFMPQSICLHKELNIKELFIFYSIIYDVKGFRLKTRIKRLCEVLNLPPLDKSIALCRIDDQRKISLAVTLLHDPQIILLDQPISGLRSDQSDIVWSYLVDLAVKQKKTILLTGHYVDPFALAHTVGLMKDGVIVCEESPETYVNHYQCESLCDIFHHIINSFNQNHYDIQEKEYFIEQSEKCLLPVTRSKIKRNHVKAQLYKNYKWAYKNIIIFLFVLLWPFMSLVPLSLSLSSFKTDIKVGYYNEEVLSVGGNCTDSQVIYAEDCPSTGFYSCNFIDSMKSKQSLVEFKSLNKGLESVREGRTLGLIYIPNNFSTSLAQTLHFMMMHMDEIKEENRLQVWLDSTWSQISSLTIKDIYESFLDMMVVKCKECDINQKLVETSISFREERPIYGENSTLLSAIYPPYDISVMFYSSYVYTMALLMMEKYSGITERLQMTGMSQEELLVGNMFLELIILLFINISTMVWIHIIQQEYCLGSYFLIFIIKFMNQILGSALGILTILFTSRPFYLNFIGLIFIFSITGLNGSLWPRQGIHWLIKPFSDFNPVIMSSNSYSNIMLKGFSLAHYSVATGGLCILAADILAISVVFFNLQRGYFNI